MQLTFSQGIITYPVSLNQQTFLQKVGSSVTLQTNNGRVDVAFSHGTENYLLTEVSTVTNAWELLANGVDYWLYWDIDTRTAVRTFGTTSLAPIYSPTTPTTPATDQHWFDTINKKMFVYVSGGWRNVIRVFAAKLNNSTFTPLGSGNINFPYAGTQAGLVAPAIKVGRILVDDTGNPIRRGTGTFFTSEQQFFTNGSPVSISKLETNIPIVTALEPIAKYQVVKLSDFGKVRLASYNDLQTTAIAMAVEDLLTGQAGSVCAQGYITNPDWNFSTVGAELWINSVGQLTESDLHLSDPITYPVGKPPVGRVFTPQSIIFDQGLGGKGDTGATGAGNIRATDLIAGISKLSVPAVVDDNPVVVGDNDPRMTDARTPLTHTHTLAGSLTDVVLTMPATDQVLTYNGTNWINQDPSGTLTFPLLAPSSTTVPQYSFIDNASTGILYGNLDYTTALGYMADSVKVQANQVIAGNATPSVLELSVGESSATNQAGNTIFMRCGNTIGNNAGGTIIARTGDHVVGDATGSLLYMTSGNESAAGTILLLGGSNLSFTEVGGQIAIHGAGGSLAGNIDLIPGYPTPAVTSGSVNILGASKPPKLALQYQTNLKQITITTTETLATAYTLTLPDNTGSSGQVLTTDGTGITSWTTPASGGGATLTDDTTTNATRYITFADTTSGSMATAYVSSTKLQYNPSTGTVFATNFNTTSDLRLKTNVSPLTNSLTVLEMIGGVSFNWKDSSNLSYGVIAQEIEKILPAIVETNRDGFKSVNYIALIPFLVEAIKELSSRIERLENN